MNILVTGGLGYIGSHTVVELIESGHKPIIVDNLYNSKIEVLDCLKQITGVKPKFYKVDILDKAKLNKVFKKEAIDAVIHFAGYKAVGESVKQPLMYYHNNFGGSIALFECMQQHNVKNLIFSSSACVYGAPKSVPIDETADLNITNPYGRTKYFIEEVLKDLHTSDETNNFIILRYFNPIGAHKSGLIGEDPNGIPNNLMPYIMKVANKELEKLSIMGNDWPTKDGTGVRDYLHVVDLAKAHILALEKFKTNCGVEIYNLGNNKGYSVLEVVKAFEKVNNIPVNHVFANRRAGDVAEIYSNCKKANKELKWKANCSLEDMCRDSWNFKLKNQSK